VLGTNPKNAIKQMPNVRRVFSLLCRWLLGTYQGAVHPIHLQSYLDEFVFRFNRRRSATAGSFSSACWSAPSPARPPTRPSPDGNRYPGGCLSEADISSAESLLALGGGQCPLRPQRAALRVNVPAYAFSAPRIKCGRVRGYFRKRRESCVANDTSRYCRFALPLQL